MTTPNDIKTALDRAAAIVGAKPEIGQRAYASVATVEDGLACSITEKAWRFDADVPGSMGGTDSAASPSALFRAAVSSCVAIGIKMWAARFETPIASVEARFATDVDARGQFGVKDTIAPGFESAQLSIEIVSDAPEEAVREAVAASLRYSPMMDAIAGRFPIETDITIHDPAARKGAAA